MNFSDYSRAGAVLPVFDSNILAMFQAAQPKSGYAVRTLNPHQNATLIAMTDLIIPETDTPGAKAVRVNEFIDLILTEWAHEDERQKFLTGLEGVDKRSNVLFAKDFVDTTPAQRMRFSANSISSLPWNAKTLRTAPTSAALITTSSTAHFLKS